MSTTQKTEKKAISKKPDMVADNPQSLPYPTNVGAPAFTVPDVLKHKNERGTNAIHYLESKFDQLKQEYFKLVQTAEDTELVYNAKYAFIPVVGKVYHLYVGADEKLFLSIIEPERVPYWECKGSFKFTPDNVWQRVN
jgi:hypothetical protein